MRDLKSNLDYKSSIKPDTYTETETGSAVDMQGFDSAMVVIDSQSADTTDTDEAYTPKLQEAKDDGSGSPATADWSDVASADLQGSFADLAATPIQRVGYKRSKADKRHLRVVLTIAGTTPTVKMHAGIVLGHPSKSPV